MFGFKARSISQYIADPIASGVTIPIDSVIFYRGDMTNYAGNANWSFINVSQSGGLPSYVRGITDVTKAGLLYSKSISDSITLKSSGLHGDVGVGYLQPYKQTGTNGNIYSALNGESGNHSHTITGLSGSSYVGGAFFPGAVVGFYRCVSPTKELPANTLVLAKSLQNDDFSSIQNTLFDGVSFLSGSSTWVSTNLNLEVYGSDRKYFSKATSTSGSHKHEQLNQYGDLYSSNPTRTPNLTVITAGSHTHIMDITAVLYPKVIYYTGYLTKRNTGVYRGMILGWLGTNPATLPSGWYLCNGQTVNGVVTPALNVDRYINMTSNENLRQTISPVTGGDYSEILYSTNTPSTLTHTHYPNPSGDDNRVGYYGYYTAYHKDYEWYHNHDGYINLPYKPGYYTMNFIIYLG